MRVSAGLEDRKDELAVLARDFDAMADQLARQPRRASRGCCATSRTSCARPLARMRLAVGLARRPTADPSRQLDRMEREIERLDGLISQVLKLARLSGTDAPFEREAFDVDEVIEEVVRDANFEGAAKGCTVRTRGRRKDSVNGNRELLRSAIENVLRNAVRYSPHGCASGGRRGAQRRGAHGRRFGIGAPAFPRARSSVFSSRFTAWRNRATATAGGEGIGLAITSQRHEGARRIGQGRQSRRRRLRGAAQPAACGARRLSEWACRRVR